MRPMDATHYDIVVVIAVCFSIGLTALAAIAWMAWDTHRSMKEGLREGQRLTRAVAGLVVQESEKIRALMRD
jgi:hypothetical protein